MQGKTQFSRDEINRIRDLLQKLRRADRYRQSAIRGRLRRLGFRISDYGGYGFTTADLDDLITSGRITVTD